MRCLGLPLAPVHLTRGYSQLRRAHEYIQLQIQDEASQVFLPAMVGAQLGRRWCLSGRSKEEIEQRQPIRRGLGFSWCFTWLDSTTHGPGGWQRESIPYLL